MKKQKIGGVKNFPDKSLKMTTFTKFKNPSKLERKKE